MSYNRIGKDGYDVPDYNKEEEEQIKLQEEVDRWWYDLDDGNYKFELVESYYPDKAHLMDADEMWNGLDWGDKWDIYSNEHEEGII